VEAFCQYLGKVSTGTTACSGKVCRSAEVQPETAVRVSVGGNISEEYWGKQIFSDMALPFENKSEADRMMERVDRYRRRESWPRDSEVQKTCYKFA
jgi:hypothetical protein